MTSESGTQLIAVSPEKPDLAQIAEAGALIRAGGLVAFPTETVYGLGANALSAEAVARIFEAKGRPTNDPVIAHIHHPAQMQKLASVVPALAWQLAEIFWPGPLTMVLPRADIVPPNLSAGLETVALRLPQHPIAQALLKAADVPIGAPSANLFSRPSPTTAQHVWDDLAGRIDLILDGGPTRIGLESSVLDLTDDMPTLLRPGGIPIEILRQHIPNLRVKSQLAALNQPAESGSPGQLLKHYSPRAEVRLFSGPYAAVIERMYQVAEQLEAADERVALLIADEDALQFADLSCLRYQLGSTNNLATLGASLFAALRHLDAQNVDIILTRDFGRSDLGSAIWDRLLRAAEGRVVAVGL